MMSTDNTENKGTDNSTHKKDKKKQTPWWQFLTGRCKCHRGHDGTTSEATREKILIAAFAEMHRVGFQAASIQNILKSTGLTKGALYHHFPNKNALGYAVIDEIISESVREVWIDKLSDCQDPILTLQHIIMEAGDRFTMEDIELGCPLNNLSQEMSTIDENFRTRLDEIYTNWRASIVETLDKGKEHNYVANSLDTKQFATVFVATLEGCIGMAKSAQDMSLLMDCGLGLIDILNTLRPKGWQQASNTKEKTND